MKEPFPDAISSAFRWAETQDGGSYWKDLDNKWGKEIGSNYTRKKASEIKDSYVVGFVDDNGDKGIIIYIGLGRPIPKMKFCAIDLLDSSDNVSNTYYGKRLESFETQADCAQYLKEDYDASFLVFETPEERLKWLLDAEE